MSRLLVDTHAVLWWLTDNPQLSATARAVIADPANELRVSAASLWEIAVKRSLGKLDAPDDLPQIIAEEGFESLAVSPAHAWAVRELAPHHRDPFDRLLIAQAGVEQLAIVTKDDQFRAYLGTQVVW